MSAFDLTDAQQALAREVRAIARRELVQLADRGAEGRVNRPLVAALGKHGLLARLFAETARTAVAMDLCLLREALATVSTEAETALGLQALGGYPIVLFGSANTVDRYRDGRRGGHCRRRLRPVRSRGRLRRRRAATARRTGRRRLAAAR